MNREAPLRILVVRPDRLGDVVLSTPVFEALKAGLPQARLTVWVQEFVRPLIEGNPFVDEVVSWNPADPGLADRIRSGRFDAAIVLQTQARIAWALWRAGVPRRVGPWSKPHSFFLYNRGLRQHRSRVQMHEADYNLQLVGRLGIPVPDSRSVPTRIHLNEGIREEAADWLREHGWNSSPLVVVHPGMGGSALNWPEQYYLELIRELLRDGHPVLITGGKAENDLLMRIRANLGERSSQAMFYGGKEARALDFLAGLFSHAAVVVAPSTGPLHVAVALGKPVVTFYPPIRVQSSKRWGPYVSDSSKAAVMEPEGRCEQVHRCRPGNCQDCMRSLPVEAALKYTRGYLFI